MRSNACWCGPAGPARAAATGRRFRGLLDYSERLPHRVLEVRLCLEWGEFAHSWPDFETLAATSILAHPLHAIYLDEEALYAFTHVIMFLYDFGARPSPFLAPAQREQLRQTLTLLLVAACQDHHWDLLGELLICWDCVRLPADPIYEHAWLAFAAAQQDDGAIPGPEWVQAFRSPAEVAADAAKQPDRYFKHHYHTTLVGVLAGCLREGHAALPAEPGALAAPAPAEEPPPGLDAPTAQAAGLAQRWLEQLLDRAEQADDCPADMLCKLLLGWWMCESRWPGGLAPPGPRWPAAWGRRWPRVTAAQPGQFAKTTAVVKLLIAALLAGQDQLVPSLHGFLWQAAEVLPVVPAPDADTDLAFCEKRVILHALGLHPPPARLAYPAVLEAARRLPLTSAATGVEDLLLRINSWTAFGTQPVALAPGDGWVADLLAGLATYYLRQYDFVLGGQLLQALSAVGGAAHPGCGGGPGFYTPAPAPRGRLRLLWPRGSRPARRAGHAALPRSRLPPAGHAKLPVGLGRMRPAAGACTPASPRSPRRPVDQISPLSHHEGAKTTKIDHRSSWSSCSLWCAKSCGPGREPAAPTPPTP